ncbi:hypothetical protein DW096_16275 [Bacteroides sp. AM07-18]|uniref:Uncharacterized protein n=1 Tax=Bacteroides uniformis TaxID=820 RepID=A0A414JQV7_BACUN
MVLSLPSSHRCYQWTVIQPFELKNTYFHFLKASFHPFPTVIFLDFQSSFQYPNGLIFTILNKISLFPPYSLIINGINKISLPAK